MPGVNRNTHHVQIERIREKSKKIIYCFAIFLIIIVAAYGNHNYP